MDSKTFYHRTYIPYFKYRDSDCSYSCHKKQASGSRKRFGKGRFRYDLEDLRPAGSSSKKDPVWGNMPAPPMTRDLRIKPAEHDPSQARFQAFKMVDGKLTKTHIVEKKDQDFAKYATKWERQHSKLLYKMKSRNSLSVTPIVDRSFTVVGHYGPVNGRRLFVPERLYNISRHYEKYLELGIPIFAGNEPAGGWTHFDASEVNYHVITGIDGEVIAFLKRDFVGIESTDFWLLDAIELATGVAGLGVAIGRSVVRSLARKAAKKATKDITREMSGMTAQRAQKALARQATEGVTKALPPARYIPESGITRTHFEAFKQAAEQEKLIAVVRNTNPRSTRLIEMGCPGKKLELKMNTSDRTGVVTTTTKDEVEYARKLGYYVVDDDGIARRYVPGVWKNRKPVVEEFDTKGAFWPVEKGQIIDPKLKKPVVGDYDLMGVIDPKAPGRNMSVHTSHGAKKKDIMSPEVERIQTNVNNRIKEKRVMHGAQDQFAGYRGGATAFYPNGDVVFLKTETDVRAWYEKIGRETQRGQYARPSDDVEVVDELAKMRARKAAAAN